MWTACIQSTRCLQQALASCALGRQRIFHAQLYLGVQDTLLHKRKPFLVLFDPFCGLFLDIVAVDVRQGWWTLLTRWQSTARNVMQIRNECGALSRKLLKFACQSLPQHIYMHARRPGLITRVILCDTVAEASTTAPDGPPRYTWMCCFCINQHRTATPNAEDQ